MCKESTKSPHKVYFSQMEQEENAPYFMSPFDVFYDFVEKI